MDITTQFIELVKISSPSGHEGVMSVYLQKWLKKHGFHAVVDDVGNIYANNNKDGEPLLLCAHMDTVQPGENIVPIIENGIVKSDGKTILGADNKAALAAILTAIEESNPNKNIELLFTVKEETGGGAEFFPFNLIKSKKALIFDSAYPLGGIVLRSPYITNFEVIFTGLATHSSTPEKGINAFAPAFQALSKLPVGSLDKGETTINVGLISGGTGINTIPNQITIQGEVRSYKKILFEKHLDTIKKIMHKYAKQYKAKIHFKVSGYCAGYTHKAKDPFVTSLSKLFVTLGLSPVLYSHSGISDANVLNIQGIQTLNLTDGIQNPHTTDEQVKIADFTKLSEIVKNCITLL